MIMAKRITYFISFGLGLLLAVVTSVNADNNSTTNNEMDKDKWLKRISQIVPEPICKGFIEDASIAARLKELNMSYEDCVKAIPPIAQKCQNKYYAQIPAKVGKDSASKWGRKIGECIGAEFAINHLYADTSTSQPVKSEKADGDKQKEQTQSPGASDSTSENQN